MFMSLSAILSRPGCLAASSGSKAAAAIQDRLSTQVASLPVPSKHFLPITNVEEPKNLDLDVVWRFSDVVESGWVKQDAVYEGLSNTDRYLVVTEGSSDAAILKKALPKVAEDVADFFDFIDMSENYPFTGTGNVTRFIQGLAKIKIQNRILVVLDNDTAGHSALQTLQALINRKSSGSAGGLLKFDSSGSMGGGEWSRWVERWVCFGACKRWREVGGDREPKKKSRCKRVGFCGWLNENVLALDWQEASNYRPKGFAALGRSTSLKPPALPEVADISRLISKLQFCQTLLTAKRFELLGLRARSPKM